MSTTQPNISITDISRCAVLLSWLVAVVVRAVRRVMLHVGKVVNVTHYYYQVSLVVVRVHVKTANQWHDHYHNLNDHVE